MPVAAPILNVVEIKRLLLQKLYLLHYRDVNVHVDVQEALLLFERIPKEHVLSPVAIVPIIAAIELSGASIVRI